MLDPARVTELFLHCLYTDEECNDREKCEKEAVRVEGVMHNVGFHPGRLASAKTEIQVMVVQLDPKFQQGHSFLELCHDHKGELWTGQHKVMHELMLLAIGAGYMEYCAPKDMWVLLPGGMPYVKTLV